MISSAAVFKSAQGLGSFFVVFFVSFAFDHLIGCTCTFLYRMETRSPLFCLDLLRLYMRIVSMMSYNGVKAGSRVLLLLSLPWLWFCECNSKKSNTTP